MASKRCMIALAAIVSAIVLLGGLSVFFVNTPDTAGITVIQIMQITPTQKTTTQVFITTDSNHAQRILAGITSLIPMTGEASCPSIAIPVTYYHYKIVFRHYGIVTATAQGDSIGCFFITIKYLGGIQNTYMNAFAFWRDLHALNGAPAVLIAP